MQFEIKFWGRKFLVCERMCLCVFVYVCVCVCVCVWLELLFPIGLRSVLALPRTFSANHFSVIFYIICLIRQCHLSLSPAVSLSLSCLLRFFVCANPLLTCKFIQLSWFSTLPFAQFSSAQFPLSSPPTTRSAALKSPSNGLPWLSSAAWENKQAAQ